MGNLRFIVYTPITRVWVLTIIKGVPFGTDIAWLSINNTGMPLQRIRVAPVVHCAVTQGTGEPDTLNGQPVTA
ncbi:hypothetical protein A8C56_04805 [Niabella ginsenosidivorans]|uniref:Uncharacterized protein n=1 Tax=Niabella ginsenosidivorans TaxID=1176587 RepID=A0A1A9I129_9BACT|nr:hypothetical protein [Niabella ginsenosidivorans]ANH80392.1 hypothetical protein A8C56_04805 [Niabella ginsenosidivorans]